VGDVARGRKKTSAPRLAQRGGYNKAVAD